MASPDGFDPMTAYRLDHGTAAEAPIFLPLPGNEENLTAMTRFCRRFCPGASLIIVDRAQLKIAASAGDLPARGLVADRLAAAVIAAVRAHDLALIPIVVVGSAEGADLAADLSLAHGPILGACILIRPTEPALVVRSSALDGVHVLLLRKAAEEAPGTVTWRLCDSLKKAGAQVICQRTQGKSFGAQDVAIAHVFIAALFGT